MGTIYLRTNILNGMKYVGQTKNMKRRNINWNNTKFMYANQLLTDDREKFGLDAFETSILKECDNSELDYWERYYINEYNTIYPNGYNDNEGGSIGFHHSEKTKQKISNSEKGKIISFGQKTKLSKPIVQIKPNDTVIIWLSARKCSSETDFSFKLISQCCHHLKKTHKNNRFMFLSEYLEKILGENNS